jgi:hypothetical protein
VENFINKSFGLLDGILVGDEEVTAFGFAVLCCLNGGEHFFGRACFAAVEEGSIEGHLAWVADAVFVENQDLVLDVADVGDGKAAEVGDVVMVEAKVLIV